LTGKPQTHLYAAVCQADEKEVDKIAYLTDQLAVLCAEVGTLQSRAIAATDDLDRELDSAPAPEEVLVAAAGKGSKYDGSFSTTSTLASNLGINASSPMHISNKPSPSDRTQDANFSPSAESESMQETEGSSPKIGPELLLRLGKQSSTMGLKAATASLKAATAVSGKVGTFVTDIKDNIVANLASATGE
jgi:hypothetical protein